jgi:hypothetical protein
MAVGGVSSPAPAGKVQTTIKHVTFTANVVLKEAASIPTYVLLEIPTLGSIRGFEFDPIEADGFLDSGQVQADDAELAGLRNADFKLVPFAGRQV